MMTKFISFSLRVYFCLQVSNFAYADTIYRKAVTQDIDTILRVYRRFSTEDRRVLVTFPEDIPIGVHEPLDRSILRQDVEAGKLFLAESDNHEVLALLKLFLIQEGDLRSILEDELRAVGANRQLILAEQFNSNCVNDRHRYLESTVALCDHVGGIEFEFEPSRQVFIYYGGAYTAPAERGSGLHSRLISEALRQIQNELMLRIQLLPAKSDVIVSYGQVNANIQSKGMIQLFKKYLADLVKAQNVAESHGFMILSEHVYHYGYLAYKPTFNFSLSEQKIEVHFPEEGKGMGNLLILKLERR